MVGGCHAQAGCYEMVRIRAPESVFISVSELLSLFTTQRLLPATATACRIGQEVRAICVAHHPGDLARPGSIWLTIGETPGGLRVKT